LAQGGKAGIQAITISDERFASYRKGCDFIQRHVFPGGMLPSLGAIILYANQAELKATVTRRFGADYDRTLALWHDRFQTSWDGITPLGFDIRFKRLWEFYMAYCRAGFRTGAVDVCHVVLDKS
jgi:cyclopropane-fatty-acyl-phospholipid synthase